MLDTAKNPVVPATQVYSAKLDGADATSTTSFSLSESGYGSFSGVTFVSALTLPGLAVAGTTRVLGASAGAQASTSLTLIALKVTGNNPDAFAVLPYLGAATSKKTIVKFIPSLAADFHVALANDASNGSVDASLLVASLVPMDQGDAGLGCSAQTAKDTNADGVPDTFVGVASGTPLCFGLLFKDNALVPVKATVQVLQLVATLIAEPGTKNSGSKQVYVFVPPAP